MTATGRTGKSLLLPLLALTAGLAPGTIRAAEELRRIPPGTVVMRLAGSGETMERPAVEFNHAAHTTALTQQGCEACHRINDEGLDSRLTAAQELTDRDDLMDAFHGTCTGCHKERAASGLEGGPVTCGECHVRRSGGVSERAPMAFDYSLHARHSGAFPDKCDTCHHLYDEVAKALRYEKGAEEACRVCHGQVDVERTLSLANASHRDCVSCHLTRVRAGQEAGPVLCVGCHDALAQQAIERLAEVPRLLRGQKDSAWISVAGGRSAVVGFDHLIHEAQATTCSSCHHKRLKACRECHDLVGSAEGGGVSADRAHHDATSARSCHGCHERQASQRGCAGCHQATAQTPSATTCGVCHNGPPGDLPPTAEPPPQVTEVALEPLPRSSDAFPETVTIAGLVDRYEASTLPHAKIVAKLDLLVRESRLAGRFHGNVSTLCQGCHHRTGVGIRPPPCRSCHGPAAAATEDRPGLKVAYHRQCVGCHIAMGIEKQGCTDCHAAREVGS